MTYFPDLSRYRYLDPDLAEGAGTGALNVGWLSAEHEFAKGAVSTDVIQGVYRALENDVNVTRGIHYCEFCVWDDDPPFPYVTSPVTGNRLLLGHSEIHIVGRDGTLFAAPTWIIHYITEHQYRPPAEFCEAAVHVPPLP